MLVEMFGSFYIPTGSNSGVNNPKVGPMDNKQILYHLFNICFSPNTEDSQRYGIKVFKSTSTDSAFKWW